MKFLDYQSGTETTNVYAQQIEKMLRPLVEHAEQEENSDHRRQLLLRLVQIRRIMDIAYVLLGYGGEVAELQNKFKKVIRGDRWLYEFRDEAFHEQGDALWYAAQLASLLDHDLGDVASHNLDKLADRRERGVIKGSGDDR